MRSCRLPGIDSIVVGPADLSGSMGMLGQLSHPRVVEAIQTIAARAKQAGLFVGIGMGPSTDYAVQAARLGVQWIQCGGDFSYMVSAADSLYQGIRRRLGTA